MLDFLSEYSETQSNLIIFLQQIFGISGALLSSKLINTFLGRRYTTFLTFGLTGVFCLLFYTNSNYYYVKLIQMIWVNSMLYLFLFAGFGGLLTIGPESFPTHVRGAGVAFAHFLSRFGGVIAPILDGILVSQENGKFIALSLFGITFISTGASVLMLNETRKMKIP